MNEKRIATIGLRDECFSSLEDTLREAAAWVQFAAAQGTDLAVLPETINLLHRRDPSTPIEEFALEDWRQATAIFCDAAARAGVALVLPLLVREDGVLANRYYVLGRAGNLLGHYQKRFPAPGESACGVAPGETRRPIEWEGLKIGGGICVDVYRPQAVFEEQVNDGADFFVVPSYTPAGLWLDFCAVHYGVPVVLAYSPWSRIVDRDGTELAAGGFRSETLRAGYGSPVLMAAINFDAVTLFADFNQEKMRDVQRSYGPRVRIRFNQANCLFLLESRSADLGVREIMREFGLISRRDYFAQQDTHTRRDEGRLRGERNRGEADE